MNRQIDRQTNKQIDKKSERYQTYGWTDRHIENDRQTDRHVDSQISKWYIDKETNRGSRQINRQADRVRDNYIYIDKEWLTDRYEGSQMSWKTQADTQLARHIERHRQRDKYTDRQIGKQIDSVIDTRR